jgi:hypothetical protein
MADKGVLRVFSVAVCRSAWACSQHVFQSEAHHRNRSPTASAPMLARNKITGQVAPSVAKPSKVAIPNPIVPPAIIIFLIVSSL